MKSEFYFCEFFAIVLFVVYTSADDGFLNATCKEAKDCYVLDDPNDGLQLACWYNVNKCKCDNTIRSNYHLKWENNQCLMSKYGPCGQKGDDLVVGCQDGFICVDNSCRDPKDTKTVKLSPYSFEKSLCTAGACQFSDDLRLTCNYDEDHCNCEKVYIADGRDTYWDIRNYDGDHTCSTGKFGPCGTRNGITITCHGVGLTCVNGTCLDANHPISNAGDECATTTNCRDGLLCSQDYICIEPFSLAVGKICEGKMECQEGLECRSNGPWSLAFCEQPKQEVKEN